MKCPQTFAVSTMAGRFTSLIEDGVNITIESDAGYGGDKVRWMVTT